MKAHPIGPQPKVKVLGSLSLIGAWNRHPLKWLLFTYPLSLFVIIYLFFVIHYFNPIGYAYLLFTCTWYYVHKPLMCSPPVSHCRVFYTVSSIKPHPPVTCYMIHPGSGSCLLSLLYLYLEVMLLVAAICKRTSPI